MAGNPVVIVLAGPNGAGKTTASARLLRDYVGMREFVNADAIAQGMSAFNPEGAAIAAGRAMLSRVKELAHARESFAFETTLASRSFAPWIRTLCTVGYHFHLFFFWLDSPETAIQRVKRRVSLGGHHVPDDVVRRRYHGGLRNFFDLYQPIAVNWRMYDNCETFDPLLIAAGETTRVVEMPQPEAWRRIREQYDAT